jgi:hypothetical protein
MVLATKVLMNLRGDQRGRRQWLEPVGVHLRTIAVRSWTVAFPCRKLSRGIAHAQRTCPTQWHHPVPGGLPSLAPNLQCGGPGLYSSDSIAETKDVSEGWRPEPESNRRARICSPLRNHSAIGPRENSRLCRDLRLRQAREEPEDRAMNDGWRRSKLQIRARGDLNCKCIIGI